MLLANAADPAAAIAAFEAEIDLIVPDLQQGKFSDLENRLACTARRFARIPLTRPTEAVPTILLAGEIFVRRDAISRQNITERLAEKGFATICSPISEWMLYTDYLVKSGRSACKPTFLEFLKLILKSKFKVRYEKRIKSILSQSGLVSEAPVNLDHIIKNGSHFISPELGGEAILTVGSALTEIINHACGVIAIGPFGCMPNRVAESILSEIMNRKDKLVVDPDSKQLRIALADIDELPFLAIESDGSPFPQVINAKLEAFCLRAKRLHERLYTMN